MANSFFFPTQNLATLGPFFPQKKPFVKITLTLFFPRHQVVQIRHKKKIGFSISPNNIISVRPAKVLEYSIFVFFFNFVKLLIWQSSIRKFSQILAMIKYKCKKTLKSTHQYSSSKIVNFNHFYKIFSQILAT
jgi:hypothetical protein